MILLLINIYLIIIYKFNKYLNNIKYLAIVLFYIDIL